MNKIIANNKSKKKVALGYSITGLLGGSIFIEQIFNYPGMGLLFMDSIMNRDYSVITDLVLLYGILTLIGSPIPSQKLEIIVIYNQKTKLPKDKKQRRGSHKQRTYRS